MNFDYDVEVQDVSEHREGDKVTGSMTFAGTGEAGTIKGHFATIRNVDDPQQYHVGQRFRVNINPDAVEEE